MTGLAALNADVVIVISLFLSDKDACSLFRTSRSMLRMARLPSLWKARSMTFMSAIQSPAMVSAFRRDIVMDGLDPGAAFDWAQRYRSVRLLHPKGLLISADLLAWFDVADAAAPSPAVVKLDPDSDSEMMSESPERLSAPGAFLHHFFQRLLHPNDDFVAPAEQQDAAAARADSLLETDEGRGDVRDAARMARDHALSLSRFMRIRPDPGLGQQETSQFLHGRLVTVQRLVPSSSRARSWARIHSRDPIQKLARYHRYGMFWLQIDHDDMSFRADKPFPRPSSSSCWQPGQTAAAAAALSYFECTVVRQPMAVGIGLCDEKFHSRTPGVFIGWPASPGASYGFHGDDGLKFHNDGRGQDYSGPYGAGDTIGCGLDWSRGSIFFTKNGVFLGEAFRDVEVGPDAKWFPTVSLKHILSRRPNALKSDDPDDDATDAIVFNSGMQGTPFVYDLQGYTIHPTGSTGGNSILS